MANHTKIVNELTSQFKSQLNTDSDPVDVFRSLMTEHYQSLVDGSFESSKKSKKSSARIRKNGKETSDKPKKSNWQAVWSSNEYGCKKYFNQQMEEISKQNPDLDRFGTYKLVRQWANENNRYAEWQDWAKVQLEKDGKPVPSDVSSKQVDTTTKATTTTSSSTKEEQTTASTTVTGTTVTATEAKPVLKSDKSNLPKEVAMKRQPASRGATKSAAK